MIRTFTIGLLSVAIIATTAFAETPTRGTPEIQGTSKSLAAFTEHGLGFRAGYSMIPVGVLKLFYTEASTVDGFTIAPFWTRRFTPFFSLVTTLAATRLRSTGQVWLQKDKSDRAADVVNVDMWFISADATAYFDIRIAKWFAIHMGAGLGFGFPTGDVTTQDAIQCPAGYLTVKECGVAAGTPIESKNIPPILPVINLVMGLRFDFTEFLTLRMDFAVRDGFIFQGGLAYNF